MKAFDTRTYSINDFREWNAREQLELAPRFQRRQVWKANAKSFLVDTIIRSRPMPKVFLRQKTEPSTKTTIREVVDGQQRIRAILEFLDNGFRLSKIHNSDYGGLYFGELPDDVQRSYLDYELAVDLLLDATDQDVLDIFSRINSYGVILNSQEKLNAKYFGEFKLTAYELALEFLTFWRKYKIFSDQQILRMAEVELVSELLVAMNSGIQARKAIEPAYRKYDSSFPKRAEFSERFKRTMDLIGDVLGPTLGVSSFSRPPLFYSLYLAFYHSNYGLPEFDVQRRPIRKTDEEKVQIAISELDAVFNKSESDRTDEERIFQRSTRLATTDASVRRTRTNYICNQLNLARS